MIIARIGHYLLLRKIPRLAKMYSVGKEMFFYAEKDSRC